MIKQKQLDYQNRQLILASRSSMLSKNPSVFKGNTRERSQYLKMVEASKPSLTPFQMSYLVGLVLSDASVETNMDAKTCRIKIQQMVANRKWLEYIRKIFLEYSGNDEPILPTSTARFSMCEYQTLKCNTFYNAVNKLFYPTTRKSINPELEQFEQFEQWINPVTLAAWICGDGGSWGNSIELNTQGFTADENQLLVEMLNKQLGIKSRVITHKTRGYSKIAFYPAEFDHITALVGPYIHEDFYYRIPKGRAEGSRFGTMTVEKRDALVGSKHGDLDSLIHGYEPENQ